MAIFRKDHLASDKTGLTRYYTELMAVLEGAPPLAGQAAQFQQNSEDFQREFTDIDLMELTKAIGRFKVEVDHLKTLAKRQAKPVRQT